jgi:TrmH family RNA methyltransferase
VPVEQVSAAEIESAADTETPQGVLAIAEIPRHELPVPVTGTRILVLDALQDPGNVGTVIRTAMALGASATVALPGTVDLWNAKVVRSTMGAIFSHPAIMLGWEELVVYLDEHRVPLWAADADGTPVEQLTEMPSMLALAVSNEGAGLSAHVKSRAVRRIAISMSSGVDSLNVAVATGILLHSLRSFD